MEELGRCIRVRLEEPYIVIVNNCDDELAVDSVEVSYHIRVRVPSRRDEVLEEREVRKEVMERIKVGGKVEPGGSLRVYFGSVSGITSVNVVVKVDDKLYRVSGVLER